MSATKLCLQPDELVEITGYRQKSKQCWWLRANKVPHKTNALGKPVVSRAKWEEVQGRVRSATKDTPDWGAMKGATT